VGRVWCSMTDRCWMWVADPNFVGAGGGGCVQKGQEWGGRAHQGVQGTADRRGKPEKDSVGTRIETAGSPGCVASLSC